MTIKNKVQIFKQKVLLAKSNKGQANLAGSQLRKVLFTVIGIVLVFSALADTSDDVGNAAGNITAASDVYPFTSFFAKKGVLLLAFMGGIVLTFVGVFLKN